MSPQDLVLFRHFAIFTSFSISNSRELQRLWQLAVPREAIPHDFLMHAILGVAAAHLAHLLPNSGHDYEQRASIHRNRAMQSALPALAKVTPTNCHALFAFAGVTAFSMFALPYWAHGCSNESPVDRMLIVFSLSRGPKILLDKDNALEWIKGGEMQLMLEPRGRWLVKGKPRVHALPENIQVRFDNLMLLNELSQARSAEQGCYKTAIQKLHQTFEALRGTADDTSVFVWVALVPDEYVRALRARKPMALIILAHWGVLLYQIRGQWWSGNRGAQMVEAIREELPAQWQSAIQWPIEITRRDL